MIMSVNEWEAGGKVLHCVQNQAQNRVFGLLVSLIFILHGRVGRHLCFYYQKTAFFFIFMLWVFIVGWVRLVGVVGCRYCVEWSGVERREVEWRDWRDWNTYPDRADVGWIQRGRENGWVNEGMEREG